MKEIVVDNVDLKVRKFSDYLINYINSVEDLPAEIKRLVVYEILTKLEKESNKAISQQQAALTQENEKGVVRDAETLHKDQLGESSK